MTEQWSFEVTVKNVTDGEAAAARNFYFICLGLLQLIFNLIKTPIPDRS